MGRPTLLIGLALLIGVSMNSFVLASEGRILLDSETHDFHMQRFRQCVESSRFLAYFAKAKECYAGPELDSECVEKHRQILENYTTSDAAKECKPLLPPIQEVLRDYS